MSHLSDAVHYRYAGAQCSRICTPSESAAAVVEVVKYMRVPVTLHRALYGLQAVVWRPILSQSLHDCSKCCGEQSQARHI